MAKKNVDKNHEMNSRNNYVYLGAYIVLSIQSKFILVNIYIFNFES